MRNFKSIFLVLVLFICMLFGGCSKQQVDTTNYLTNYEYVEELQNLYLKKKCIPIRMKY